MVDSNSFLYLRLVCESDLELIYAWKSNPIIVNSFNIQSNNPNTWEDAIAWWKGLGNRMVFIVKVAGDVTSATFWRGREIGLGWVENLKSEYPEIGGFIGNLDYCNVQTIVAMYALLMNTVYKMRGISRYSVKVNKDNGQLLQALSNMGWQLNCQLENGVVDLRYAAKERVRECDIAV